MHDKETKAIRRLTKLLTEKDYIQMITNFDDLKDLRTGNSRTVRIELESYKNFLTSRGVAIKSKNSQIIFSNTELEQTNNLEKFIQTLPKNIELSGEYPSRLNIIDGSLTKAQHLISDKLSTLDMVSQAKEIGSNYLLIDNTQRTIQENILTTTIEAIPYAIAREEDYEKMAMVDVDNKELKTLIFDSNMSYRADDCTLLCARLYPSQFMSNIEYRYSAEGYQERIIQQILPLIKEQKLDDEVMEFLNDFDPYKEAVRSLARDYIVGEPK